MAASRRSRPCGFCRRWFVADVRVGDRQIACGEPACRRARKAAAQRAWIERHPGYFRGRGEEHRTWRREHPDAQRERRAKDPELRERERVERARRRREAATRRAVEQDAMALQLVVRQGDPVRVAGAVEQDAMRAQLHVLIGVASQLPTAVEQGPIAGALRTWHDRGRRVLGGAHGRLVRSP